MLLLLLLLLKVKCSKQLLQNLSELINLLIFLYSNFFSKLVIRVIRILQEAPNHGSVDQGHSVILNQGHGGGYGGPGIGNGHNGHSTILQQVQGPIAGPAPVAHSPAQIRIIRVLQQQVAAPEPAPIHQQEEIIRVVRVQAAPSHAQHAQVQHAPLQHAQVQHVHVAQGHGHGHRHAHGW